MLYKAYNALFNSMHRINRMRGLETDSSLSCDWFSSDTLSYSFGEKTKQNKDGLFFILVDINASHWALNVQVYDSECKSGHFHGLMIRIFLGCFRLRKVSKGIKRLVFH